MNKTIRVSMDLLERIAYIMHVDIAYLYKEEKELRALLSQPAEQQDDYPRADYELGYADAEAALQSELNEARTSIAHLLIELDAVPKWQAIETAPRDGTEILLRKVDRVTSGAWCVWKDTYPEYHSSTGEYLGMVICGESACWGTWDGGFTDGDYPTHWMPLPAPPVSLTDEGKASDDMRISLISDEKIGEVPCSEHPDAPHGFNRNASHCADRYVCDCEGWVPTDEGKA